MGKYVVVVTNSFDPHTDHIISILHSSGVELFRLNTESIPLDVSITIDLTSDNHVSRIKNNINGLSLNTSSIRSIWWRRPAKFSLPKHYSEQEQNYAEMETGHALNSIWMSSACYWMSFPSNIRQASWKLAQLQRAAKMGFDIPRTIVTNVPEEALAFYESCAAGMIFKVMSDPFLGADTVTAAANTRQTTISTRTSIVSDKDLELLDTISPTPCLFQEYIPKYVELRVTLIGDELFAAEIDSQAHPETSVDYRHHYIDIPYRKATLPSDLEEKCFKFVRSYGLNYSALDLILTPDGRYVFLENNPNGQFIFVEMKVPELKMSSALAACLTRGANN